MAAVGPVDDADAHRVMTAYHRVLAQGVDAAEALELASAGVEEGRLFCSYGADFSWPAASVDHTLRLSGDSPRTEREEGDMRRGYGSGV